PVLIQGETGTGKELVARAIHKRSLRSERPFIAVSCGALPETLLESELFGHVKGAFTGAIADKIGLFQEANHGTLFLDEISETSPATQVKLLRVLQEGEIRRVGSTKDEKVDVRILAASNRDLETLVRERMLREDLFYRLNVFPVYLPPLKDRQDDVLILAEHFMRLFSLKNRKKIGAISKNAQKVLQSYPWPGNVRELANVTERAVILAKDETITENELLLPVIKPSKGKTFLSDEAVTPETLASMSRLKIQEALDKNRGNKTQTARELGISRTTLWRRIKEERSGS
ncbi:MAG: sigma-54 dependent transcriptional regulator, partial [Candidatus Omnitrophica bacterium]|nr:sigma-54 dependent transcriptional regulator [Candidatus Omnitrophota bacterium]